MIKKTPVTIFIHGWQPKCRQSYLLPYVDNRYGLTSTYLINIPEPIFKKLGKEYIFSS